MSEPSRALRELLLQHAKLREMMDECESIADALDRGITDERSLARELTKLRLAFVAHNVLEEQTLPALLREQDAFGDIRIGHMIADHAEEHRMLRMQLDAATPDLRAALYELRAHLVAEERGFLSPRILRDDLVTLESAG
jgi:hypothetical protein